LTKISLPLPYSSQARIIRKQGLKIYIVKPLRLSERPYKLKTRIFEYFSPGTSKREGEEFRYPECRRSVEDDPIGEVEWHKPRLADVHEDSYDNMGLRKRSSPCASNSPSKARVLVPWGVISYKTGVVSHLNDPRKHPP